MENKRLTFTLCLIFISLSVFVGDLPARTTEYRLEIQSLLDDVSMDNLQEHVQELCWANGHQSRITYTDGNYAAVEYIAAFFESLPGITEVVRDTFYIPNAVAPWNTYPLINVIALKEGDSLSDEVVLLGGHYDSSGSRESNYTNQWATRKAQGADDNASGVAAMMEIARVLCDPENGFANRATLKFIAFAAEEYHPMHSSIHHAGSMWDAYYMDENDENLRAAVILDMIAFNSTWDYVEIISDFESLWLADRIREARDAYVPTLTTNSGLVDVPYSDHESYQYYGFPAVLLMENDKPWNDHSPYYARNPNYHTSADTSGTLNYSLMTLVTKTTLASIAEFASSEPSAVAESDRVMGGSNRITASPNPFNAETTIYFSLDRADHASVTLFDSRGREVEALQRGVLEAGDYELHWDGGEAVSGLYFCVFQTAQEKHVFKLTLIR